MFSPEDVTVQGAAFVVAWVDECPVGCGAVKPLDEWTCEFKRDCDAAELFPKQLTSPEKKQKQAEKRKATLNGAKQLTYSDPLLPY